MKCKVQRGGGQSIAGLAAIVGHVVVDDGEDHPPAGPCLRWRRHAPDSRHAVCRKSSGDAQISVSSLDLSKPTRTLHTCTTPQLCSALVYLARLWGQGFEVLRHYGQLVGQYVCPASSMMSIIFLASTSANWTAASSLSSLCAATSRPCRCQSDAAFPFCQPKGRCDTDRSN